MGAGRDPLPATAGSRGAEDLPALPAGRVERLVFGRRPLVLAAAAAITAVLGWTAAARHVVDAEFERTLPVEHPFVRTWLEHREALPGLGNALQVVVESTRGHVFEAGYLEALRRVGDELQLTPGVDRRWVRSLWAPSVRWTEVTEEGFRGGPVLPPDYDGSPRAVEELRRNALRAGIVGTLVAPDARSTAVLVPLLDRDPATGERLDHGALSRALEDLRARHEREGEVRVRIVGFAKLAGDLVEGSSAVAAWFAVAAAIVAASLFLHTRCARSAALVLACAATAVVWQMGIVSALGLALDPFSVLVPFLVFSLGVSHGAQKTNGVLQDVGRGVPRLHAARRTFRRLSRAGLAALLTDAAGFGVLALIPVPAVRQMALTATVGVLALVLTTLVLLPVLLSYAGVSAPAAARSLARPAGGSWGAAWRLLERLTERRRATAALAVAAAASAAALAAGSGVALGDLGHGAPELRPSSRYNLDDAYVAASYGRASDRFAVIVTTPPDRCADWETLVEADRLAWRLRQLPGVRSTESLPDAVRGLTAAGFEGSPRWLALSRDPAVLNHAVQQAIVQHAGLVDPACSVMPVVAHLRDHRAGTLEEVVRAASAFARDHDAPERRFRLAAGSAAFEAATHEVVRGAAWRMTACVYAAVILLSFAALRSWRAVLVTVLPLACVSILTGALMVALGIGVRLSTLPVIALGVGVPDFALYLLSVQLEHRRAGIPLAEAHRRSMRFTGRVVALVGLTLAAGVVTWAASPVKLQADMGVLLTFMFLGNMVAALVLVPALSRFLLDDPRPAAAPAAVDAGRRGAAGEVGR